MEWLDVIQIFLLLTACLACFVSGRVNGIKAVLEHLLEKEIITMKDLDDI